MQLSVVQFQTKRLYSELGLAGISGIEGLTWFSPKCGLGVVVIEVADHLDHLSILMGV